MPTQRKLNIYVTQLKIERLKRELRALQSEIAEHRLANGRHLHSFAFIQDYVETAADELGLAEAACLRARGK